MVQLGILQNLCMDCRNTIYGEAIMNINMCHMHTHVVVNDLYLGIFIFNGRSLVQLPDNRH